MTIPPVTIGTLIAILVLLLAIVLGIMGSVPWIICGFLIALSLARLL